MRTLSAIYANEGESVPLSVTGADAAELDTIYGLSGKLTEGSYQLDDGDALVGTRFAEEYGVWPGDEFEMLLPSGHVATFTVSGVFDLGQGTANERFVFVDAASAADALGMTEDEYSAVQIQLTDLFASSEVAPRLADAFGVEAVDWQAENEELLSGLAAQSGSSAMIQVFVLVAVALGIASTLAISAVQKTRQIGILKAIGMGDARDRPHLPVAGGAARGGRHARRHRARLRAHRALQPRAGAILDQARADLHRDLRERSASPWRCCPRSSRRDPPRVSTRSR